MADAADTIQIEISDDPLESLPIGTSIPLTPVAFGGSTAGLVPDHTANFTFFEGALLTIVFRNEAGLHPLGTATMIGPGLALTATHVLTDHLDGVMAGNTAVMAFGPRPGGGDAWRVRTISTTEEDDIAVLGLSLASPIKPAWRLTTLPLTTRAPKVDEQLTAIGFRFDHSADDGAQHLEIGGGLILAAGPVTAVYPTGRDHLLLPYPTIEIGCGSVGAMSGGPVLDSAGHIVGVVSRGWSIDDGRGPSYAQWVPSVLVRRITPVWPPGAFPPDSRLIDLSPGGIFLEGSDAIAITGETTYTIRIWFDR